VLVEGGVGARPAVGTNSSQHNTRTHLRRFPCGRNSNKLTVDAGEPRARGHAAPLHGCHRAVGDCCRHLRTPWAPFACMNGGLTPVNRVLGWKRGRLRWLVPPECPLSPFLSRMLWRRRLSPPRRRMVTPAG
jgi:hypothetical protein